MAGFGAPHTVLCLQKVQISESSLALKLRAIENPKTFLEIEFYPADPDLAIEIFFD
jgi:hypothetical protein